MVLWGFNFVAVKVVLGPHGLTVGATTLVRFVLMYSILIVFCLIKKESLQYPKGDAFRILLQGFMSMGVYMVFYMLGMKDSTAGEGAIIMTAAPIFTILFAFLAGQEKFRVQSLIGIAIALGGVIMVVTARQKGVDLGAHLKGNVTVFASTIIWAIGTVMSRPLVAKYDPVRVLALSMPGALVALAPVGLMDVIHLNWRTVSGETAWMMIYMAAGSGAAGFALFNAGIRKVGAGGAMMYQYLVAPLAAVFAYLYLGESLHPLQLLGLVVVIAGVTLATTGHRSIPRGKVDQTTVQAVETT